MSFQHYTEKDVCRDVLKSQTTAIIGYGSQGRAHALNMRDQGYQVVIGLREGGRSALLAKKDGWTIESVTSATAKADLVSILLPDMIQPKVYKEEIEPHLKPQATVLFAHGLNIHYKMILVKESHNVVLVAPKSPGHLVREQFEIGKGVPSLLAVAQDADHKAFDIALSYAHAIGTTRAGVVQTTFAEETETDLFGEQAVLCGGVRELITAGFETLVEAGYQPEVAFFECMHELKLIVDLIYEGGLTRMHEFISETAKYGDLTRGPRIIGESSRKAMKSILEEIQNGTFAKEWNTEHQAGCTLYKRKLDVVANHLIEKVGKNMRSRMSWIKKN